MSNSQRGAPTQINPFLGPQPLICNFISDRCLGHEDAWQGQGLLYGQICTFGAKPEVWSTVSSSLGRGCGVVFWGVGEGEKVVRRQHKTDLTQGSYFAHDSNKQSQWKIHYSKQVKCLGWLSICKQRGISPKIGRRLTGNNSTCQSWSAWKWNICITLNKIPVWLIM